MRFGAWNVGSLYKIDLLMVVDKGLLKAKLH
jgi:hypothetical protein